MTAYSFTYGALWGRIGLASLCRGMRDSGQSKIRHKCFLLIRSENSDDWWHLVAARCCDKVSHAIERHNIKVWNNNKVQRRVVSRCIWWCWKITCSMRGFLPTRFPLTYLCLLRRPTCINPEKSSFVDLLHEESLRTCLKAHDRSTVQPSLPCTVVKFL